MKQVLLCLIFVSCIAIACGGLDPRQRDMARYAGNAPCLGFLSDNGVRGYLLPVDPHAAMMSLLWQDATNAFMLVDVDRQLHVIYEATAGQEGGLSRLHPITADDISVAKNRNKVAVTLITNSSFFTYVYSLGQMQLEKMVGPIARVISPEWHPSEPLLVAHYYPEDERYQSGTNLIRVIDVSSPTAEVVSTYELAYSYIEEVFGWSATGQVIAVSQHGKNGLTPQYVFPNKDPLVQGSLFSTARFTCVREGQWAPEGDVMAFSGVNETMEGWDIFVETVAAPGSSTASSLVNLTNSPREDERGAAWSPNGEYITYSKAYEDTEGNLRQELYLIELYGLSSSPLQLTDTLDEFESNPIWLSQSEIAYLSWRPAEESWSLNILSTSEGATTSRRVIEIPSSWYWNPLTDDER